MATQTVPATEYNDTELEIVTFAFRLSALHLLRLPFQRRRHHPAHLAEPPLRLLLPLLFLRRRGARLLRFQTQFHLICIHHAAHCSEGTWTNAVHVKIFPGVCR